MLILQIISQKVFKKISAAKEIKIKFICKDKYVNKYKRYKCLTICSFIIIFFFNCFDLLFLHIFYLFNICYFFKYTMYHLQTISTSLVN